MKNYIDEKRIMNYTSEGNETSCSAKFTLSETNLVMSLTMLENVIALAVLFTVPTRHTNTHFLIRVLAVNDLFSCTAVLMSSAIMLATCNGFAESVGCDILGWIAMSSFCWSLHIVCVMNVERYFMVCRPVFHRNHFSVKVCGVLAVAGLGIVTLVLGLPLVGVGRPYLFYDDNKLCAFDLSPGIEPAHRCLVGLASALGILWVLVTSISNVEISRKLNQEVFKVADIKTQNASKAAKKKHQFGLVTKVVAAVNCALNLPFYVSLFIPYC